MKCSTKILLSGILEAVQKKKITERQIKETMERIIHGIEFSDAMKFEEHDSGKIEERIINLLKEKPGLSDNAYMGLLMKEFHGKIDAKNLMEIIKKYKI